MIAQKHDQLPLDFGTLKAGEITSAIIAYLTKHGFKVWIKIRHTNCCCQR